MRNRVYGKASNMKLIATRCLILGALLLSAAIFGFFYAWVCSTMWGLDATDPRVAIQAMQAMNGSVRNGVFAPAFFGTPFLLFLTGFVVWRQGAGNSAVYFSLSGVIYLVFGMILTIAINVPMNEALGAFDVPTDIQTAQKIWDDYSPTWQFWNQMRTIASGVSFGVAVLGLFALPSAAKQGAI